MFNAQRAQARILLRNNHLKTWKILNPGIYKKENYIDRPTQRPQPTAKYLNW